MEGPDALEPCMLVFQVDGNLQSRLARHLRDRLRLEAGGKLQIGEEFDFEEPSSDNLQSPASSPANVCGHGGLVLPQDESVGNLVTTIGRSFVVCHKVPIHQRQLNRNRHCDGIEEDYEDIWGPRILRVFRLHARVESLEQLASPDCPLFSWSQEFLKDIDLQSQRKIRTATDRLLVRIQAYPRSLEWPIVKLFEPEEEKFTHETIQPFIAEFSHVLQVRYQH